MATPKEKIECLFDFHTYEWQTKGKTKTFRCTKCDSPHPEYSVLKTITYKKWGYELRDVAHDHADYGGPPGPFKIRNAYTLNGDYIGDKETANVFCRKLGIKPEKAAPDHNICTIGFCEADQKWYGWSHRVTYGFGIGETVKLGDCGYIPENRETYIEQLKRWYTDDNHINVKVEVKEDGIHISYDYVGRSSLHAVYPIEPLDIPYGRGEWTAKTLEDCKEMAIAFAESVS